MTKKHTLLGRISAVRVFANIVMRSMQRQARLGNRILKKTLGIEINRVNRLNPFQYHRIAAGSSESCGATGAALKVLNVVRYTAINESSYSAKSFDGAYHTFAIPPFVFRGQRDPSKRLKTIPIDFTGKRILDLGCNQGGMLLHLSNKLLWGVGVDFDPKHINVANRIKSARGVANCDFYTFDLDRDPLDLLLDFLRDDNVDIVFLFALCMWLTKWREVIVHISKLTPVVVFESNGTEQQQNDQLNFLRSLFASVELLADRLPDDPQHPRKLFLATNNGVAAESGLAISEWKNASDSPA
jgi:SAM-dependent methyltransferase